jgi:hypothetical protein
MARSVMEHSVALTDHPRRDDILLAIGEHDNGWADEDTAPTVDRQTGRVVDFVNASLMVRHTVWPRGVERLAHRPWAAALVAQHALTVYDRFRGDADWVSFFDAMQSARDRMVRADGGRLDDLDADYPFVRLGDLISLAFCAGWTDEQFFADWRVNFSGHRVRVTPDPFDGKTIPIAVEVRAIARHAFPSDIELRAALATAPATRISDEVTGGL